MLASMTCRFLSCISIRPEPRIPTASDGLVWLLPLNDSSTTPHTIPGADISRASRKHFHCQATSKSQLSNIFIITPIIPVIFLWLRTINARRRRADRLRRSIATDHSDQRCRRWRWNRRRRGNLTSVGPCVRSSICIIGSCFWSIVSA